jgi:hypothetical protein
MLECQESLQNQATDDTFEEHVTPKSQSVNRWSGFEAQPQEYLNSVRQPLRARV